LPKDLRDILLQDKEVPHSNTHSGISKWLPEDTGGACAVFRVAKNYEALTQYCDKMTAKTWQGLVGGVISLKRLANVFYPPTFSVNYPVASNGASV